MEQNSLDISDLALIFLQAKHTGATVRTCYSTPTGSQR